MATQNSAESTSPRLVYIVVPDQVSTQPKVNSNVIETGPVIEPAKAQNVNRTGTGKKLGKKPAN